MRLAHAGRRAATGGSQDAPRLQGAQYGGFLAAWVVGRGFHLASRFLQAPVAGAGFQKKRSGKAVDYGMGSLGRAPRPLFTGPSEL